MLKQALVTRKDFPILLGNFLEFYDFTLFAALLPIIAPILFPSKEIVDSFISGYVFLAIGFLARPMGAILFGYIGDHYSRKTALILAILLMSLATFGIGILPTYNAIGVYALVILALCRILQGLSAGGEYSGAGLTLTENAYKDSPFLKGAILTASGLLGAFVASTVSAMTSMAFFPKESWRILFLIGGCIGLVTLWFRLSMEETRPVQHTTTPHTVPWSSLLKKYKVPFLCSISFGALMNVPFYLITGFINTYFVATGTYARTTLMLMNAFVVLFCAIVTVLFGLLSKRRDPLKMMFYASLGMSLFSFPFFFLVHTSSFICFIAAELVLILLSQMFVAPAFATMASLFPYAIRYRGVAIGASFGLAFLGGSTPYISAHLIRYTGLAWSPAFYLCLISTLACASVMMISRHQWRSQAMSLDPQALYQGAI
ncbi:MAG: MFS transporter [Gammaproteobacteria bacterium]|nr:MFS transporter [Gammaproteobacteria bacterium]MBP9728788.1 MFS transporter [Gammaproteobacteria bacterium]